MSETTAPRRLNTRHLRRHALKAIRERLLYPAPEALRAVERDGDSVILRLNSGGNVCAVEQWLNMHGYHAEYDGSNPDGYGGAVRVRLRSPLTDFPVVCTACRKPVIRGQESGEWFHADSGDIHRCSRTVPVTAMVAAGNEDVPRDRAFVIADEDVTFPDEGRACSRCGDRVSYLSSRDMCDGCEEEQ